MADVTARWTRIQTLFEQALERPADERTAWLRATCGDDPALYREVEALLDGEAHAHTLFAGRASDLLSPAEMSDALAATRPSRAGERVGPWVLGERIGEGGMGAVYRAERDGADTPGGFEQTAALKHIKLGMDSEAVLARFRAERRILARLEHPGIAHLLDGGLDADGRPYFAMEYVEGEPITDYADARHLGIDARLQVFEQVCEAVAYAHRQLVVHRDLKPSNVLVADTEDGSGPAVKLLDFGIARVLSDEDSDAVLTRTGHRVFTPDYAAPEQIRGEAPTTATDVYALGGLLYRLLSGARPIETEGRSLLEVEQAVLDESPKRPSAAVTADAAPARATTASALEKRLRGDLDTITLKALDNDPGRRYGSAAELLADVRRHREGFPIEARPATRRYRAGLFVKRHRAGVLGTAAALVALVALTGFYTARLASERDRAEAETDRAEAALVRSEAVSGFLSNLLRSASPRANQGREVSVREVVEQAVERVDELDDRPALQADVLDVLGNTLYQLNDYPAAIALQRRSLALRQRLPGTTDSALVDAYDRLGTVYRNAGQPDSAIAVYEKGLAMARERLGPDDYQTLSFLVNLSDPYVRTGQHARAEAVSREVIDIEARTLDADDPVRAFALNNLGTTLTNEGRYDEAEPLLREAARLVRLQGDPFAVSFPVGNLGWMLTWAGRPDEGLPHVRESLALRMEEMGPKERFTAEAMQFVADALRARSASGDYAEADSLYRRALRTIADGAGEAHPAFAYSLYGHGLLALRQGQTAEAVRRLRRVVALRGAERDDAPRELARAQIALGDALAASGRTAEADKLYREASVLAREQLREGDLVRSHAAAMAGLAAGDDGGYRRGIRAVRERVGDGHPLVAQICESGRQRGPSAPACASVR